MSLTHSRELKSNELRAHRLLDRAIYYLLSLLLRSILAKHLKPKIDNRSIELSGEEQEEFAIRSWKTARYTTIVRRKKQVIRFRPIAFPRFSIIVPEEILLKRAASAVHLFSLYPASLNSLFRNPHAPFPRRRADARASMPQRTPRRSTQRRRG